jgi:cytoskeletal protein RodZ
MVERNSTDMARGRTFQQSVNLYQDVLRHIVDDSSSRNHHHEHLRLRNSKSAQVLPSWYIILVVYVYVLLGFILAKVFILIRFQNGLSESTVGSYDSKIPWLESLTGSRRF